MYKYFFIVLVLFFLFFQKVIDASVGDWQKSASIVPVSTTDFATDSFRQSLLNLKSTGVNYVTLVIPYYQSSFTSSDIFKGWNTPTDDSLISAINYAHSLGLKVALKLHIDNINGGWRLDINPTDRDVWFRNYGNMANQYADIGKLTGVEQICLGTELYNLTSPNVDSTNTDRWINLINQVRSRYPGSLTYSAQHTTPTEENEIQFWDHLDNIGLSAYFILDPNNSNPTVESLKSSWDDWNNSIIYPLSQKWNKPILFTEVGYKSVSGAHSVPGLSSYNNNFDESEQSRDYEALFSYWNDKNYMVGVSWWNWESNPHGGGQWNTDYTPQNKQAQTVMTNWFKDQPQATPTQASNSSDSIGNALYESSSQVLSTNPIKNQNLEITSQIKPNSDTRNIIVDVEIYDQNNSKIYQQYFENQNISQNQIVTYKINWQTSNAGRYRVKIGTFSNNWLANYYWNDNSLTFDVLDSNAPLTTPTPTLTPTPEPPSLSGNIDVWWPVNGATVSNVQPLKALLSGSQISDYHLYWQVDGGQINEMSDNQTDYPHKESVIDLNPWNWKGDGPYTLNFLAKDLNGNIVKQTSVDIKITHY
jgi:hypothetical protein